MWLSETSLVQHVWRRSWFLSFQSELLKILIILLDRYYLFLYYYTIHRDTILLLVLINYIVFIVSVYNYHNSVCSFSLFCFHDYFQSFGLPSLKVKPEHANNITVQEGPFGIPSPMVAGLGATKNKLGMSHPLQASEKNVCFYDN